MALAAEDAAKCVLSLMDANLSLFGCDEKTCDPAAQTSIDAAYKDCGGWEFGGIDFDTTDGAALKVTAEACKCSGAEAGLRASVMRLHELLHKIFIW